MRWFNSLTAATMIATATVVAMPMTPSAAQENNHQGQQSQRQQRAQGQQRQRQEQAQQNDKKNDKHNDKENDKDSDRERRLLQVFELEHRDPQQLMQLINLWDEVSTATGFGVGQAYPQQIAQQRQQQQQQQQKSKVVIATDPEKKLLFARGTDDQLDEIEALINAVDVEDDQLEAHEYAGHKLIPIESRSAGQVQTTLTQLELVGRMIPLGPVNFVAYRVDEDEDKLEQAEEVIDKLASHNRQSREGRNQGGGNQGSGNQGGRGDSDRNAESGQGDSDRRR